MSCEYCRVLQLSGGTRPAWIDIALMTAATVIGFSFGWYGH